MDHFFSAMDNTWDQIDDGTQHGFTTTSIQQFSQYLGTQMSGQQHQPLFEDEVICRVICVFLIEEPIKIDSYVYIRDRVHRIRFLRLHIIRILRRVAERKEKRKGRPNPRNRVNPRRVVETTNNLKMRSFVLHTLMSQKTRQWV